MGKVNFQCDFMIKYYLLDVHFHTFHDITTERLKLNDENMQHRIQTM